MAANYTVYITESNTADNPEDGSEHTDWIRIICTDITVQFTNRNMKEDLADHESFEVKLGEIVFKVTLENVLIDRIETSAGGKTCWNDYISFVGSHCMSGGSSIYFWAKPAMVDSDWMQWFDNDGDMQDYMKCRFDTFRLKISAKKMSAGGQIVLEEVWD